LPGTTILSDSPKAYSQLESEGYIHDRVYTLHRKAEPTQIPLNPLKAAGTHSRNRCQNTAQTRHSTCHILQNTVSDRKISVVQQTSSWKSCNWLARCTIQTEHRPSTNSCRNYSSSCRIQPMNYHRKVTQLMPSTQKPSSRHFHLLTRQTLICTATSLTIMPHFAESRFAESSFAESHFAESTFAENACHLLIFSKRTCRWRQPDVVC